MSEATAIGFLAPPLARYISSVLFGDTFSLSAKLASLVSTIGVVLVLLWTRTHDITNTPTPSTLTTATPIQRIAYGAVALLGVCGSASVLIITSKIGKRAHPLIIVNAFASCSTMLSAASFALQPKLQLVMPKTIMEWTSLAFLSIGGFGMVGCALK